MNLAIKIGGGLVLIALGATCKEKMKSKTEEAKLNVRQIYELVRSHYKKTGTLPPSAPLTPANPTDSCEGRKPTDELWDEGTWKLIGFRPTSDFDRRWYSYEFAPAPSGQSFQVLARGDLDCDGNYSTFRIDTVIDEDGAFQDRTQTHSKPPTVFREAELE
jgi:hypothetical protein